MVEGAEPKPAAAATTDDKHDVQYDDDTAKNAVSPSVPCVPPCRTKPEFATKAIGFG